jgi:hypothetical protein
MRMLSALLAEETATEQTNQYALASMLDTENLVAPNLRSMRLAIERRIALKRQIAASAAYRLRRASSR